MAMNCGCAADAGTTTTTLTGNGSNNYILCENDQLDITTNGDYSYPDDVGVMSTATISEREQHRQIVAATLAFMESVAL